MRNISFSATTKELADELAKRKVSGGWSIRQKLKLLHCGVFYPDYRLQNLQIWITLPKRLSVQAAGPAGWMPALC